MQRLGQITLMVKDYDEAIEFYTKVLAFKLIEDTKRSETKRWVVVAPPGENTCHLLLAKAVGEEQERSVGNQTGGRVFLFLYTDNIDRDYGSLILYGVKIKRPPTPENFGKAMVFEDLYGNLIDLIEPKGGI
ncbi:MAG: catechol 2,3-dioxygenase-like lactoylglutathione lyase family enzyme [Marinoscillum sp.]|jgi:catechol 2,3-dioxygenase-like lactoylglutathione lyase family enzyme